MFLHSTAIVGGVFELVAEVSIKFTVYCFSKLFFLKNDFVVQESHGKFEKPWFHCKTGKSQVIVTFLFQLRGMIQVESINVGVVHQDKITGITVGRLWDAPVLITYVSLFICIN